MRPNFKVETYSIFGNFATVYNYHYQNIISTACFFTYENIIKDFAVGVWKIKTLKQ